MLPNAKLTLSVVAEDPVFALRSVYLRYRTAEDETPRDWVYYDHTKDPAKLTTPATRMDIVAGPPRLRPTRLEFEMPLPIAQFKHLDGTALRPNDVLILQVCADDFDDVSANKAPGASPEIRLTIVDHSGLERDLNRDLTVIQNILREQRDKEQAAVQQVTRAENRIKQNEPMTPAELEQLRRPNRCSASCATASVRSRTSCAARCSVSRNPSSRTECRTRRCATGCAMSNASWNDWRKTTSSRPSSSSPAPGNSWSNRPRPRIRLVPPNARRRSLS